MVGVSPRSDEAGIARLLTLLAGWAVEEGGAKGAGKFNVGPGLESDTAAGSEPESSNTMGTVRGS